MTHKDLIKKFQKEMNDQGESLAVDGDYGPKTTAAGNKFDAEVVVSRKPVVVLPDIPNDATHRAPIDWARGELGQKEIYGSKDNPRIRWYHTHSANIGSREHADEVPWCASFLNAAADECGMKKTDNALAASWKSYGIDSGDDVEEGDIVVIGSSHVTLANKPFNRKRDKTFEGLGGNQSNAVNVAVFRTDGISAARKWVRKDGTITAPPLTQAEPVEADPQPEVVKGLRKVGFSGESKTLGVDVSDYQKQINWYKAKAQGVEFAFVKSTESTTWKGKMTLNHAAGVLDAGIMLGFYHFFRTTADAKTQAEFFWNQAKDIYAQNKGKCLPPMLDFETHDGDPSDNDALSAREFALELERLSGMRPIVYTGPYFYQSLGKMALNIEFDRYLLWTAHYGTSAPLVPAPWPRWAFWQFTSEFKLEGYSGGGVDANWFDGSLEYLRKLTV